MFVKLLKHEWLANRGLIGLLCAVIAGSGVLSGGILRYMTWSAAMGNDAMVVTYTIVLTAAVLAVVFCCIGAMYLLVHRFYQSRFTDRGYLMLTLPVTTHQQLLSGIVNTVAGVALVGATAILSAVVSLSIFLNAFDQSTVAELIQVFVEGLGDVPANLEISTGWMWVNILEFVISFVADVILFMLALTVGTQAHKHPVLKGAAMYIGIDILISEACALFRSLMENQLLAVTVNCAVYAATAVIAYLVMHHKIDKKLNLV